MPVEWSTSIATALATAKADDRPVLVDANGAPACVGSSMLDEESYGNGELSKYINRHFIPLRILVKQSVAEAEQLGAFWTPAAIMLDSTGKERYRIEGYLPLQEFAGHLVLGLGRIAFMHKQWQLAEDFYVEVITKHAGTKAVAEAFYWAAVCSYKQNKDIRILTEMADFNPRYRDTIWAMKTSVWGQMR